MKLNPSKYDFGVKAGKFLGFMVNERGIEAHPEKIQALQNMEEPKCIKQIQQLNGRVIALGRFISKSAEKCLPFFKALRGNDKFTWDEECSTTFKKLKEYLGSPSLLSSPITGEVLYLYIAATDHAVGAVLVRLVDSIEKPVYYVSKALTPVEGRYFNAEKLGLTFLHM